MCIEIVESSEEAATLRIVRNARAATIGDCFAGGDDNDDAGRGGGGDKCAFVLPRIPMSVDAIGRGSIAVTIAPGYGTIARVILRPVRFFFRLGARPN